MKIFYLLLIATMVAATGLKAQATVIPATASATSVEKSGIVYHTSADGDSAFNHILILPNLAMGKITLKVDDANTNVIQQGECTIFNSGGAPVAKAPFTTGTNEIFVTTMPAGMYFIRLVQKNGQVASKKFVVVR
jgi:hypothetical protein